LVVLAVADDSRIANFVANLLSSELLAGTAHDFRPADSPDPTDDINHRHVIRSANVISFPAP
jgi:hypothetical protein